MYDVFNVVQVFVDTDADVRLARRLKRDICERNRDLIGVIDQYDRFVRPSFDQFIKPSIEVCVQYSEPVY